MTHHPRTALALLAVLLMAACQNKRGDNSQSTTPTAPTSGESALPNIAGIWRGRYVVYGELSGNDGQMTWTVQQSGNRIAGTFTIQGDLLLGSVTGTISGTSTPKMGSTPNHYAVTLSSSSVSQFPGCTLILRANEYSLTTPLKQLNGVYKQALCGQSSDLENGSYLLNKQ